MQQLHTLEALPVTGFTEITLALSADGARVAGSTDLSAGQGTLAVWDVRTGRLLHRWNQQATALVFCPGGELLASGDKTGHIAIWSAKEEQPLLRLGPMRTKVEALAFGRDPRRPALAPSDPEAWTLAAGYAGGDIILWDLSARRPTAFCRGSLYDIYALAFSPDGMTLASGGRDFTRLWDRATGREILKVPTASYTTGLSYAPDGKRLAVSGIQVFGTESHSSALWRLEEGRGARSWRGLRTGAERMVFSPDERYLAALSQDWQLAIWDRKAGKLALVLDVPPGYYTDNVGLAFSPDDQLFAFSSGSQVGLWEVATGQERGRWYLPPGLIDRLAFDRTGKKLLSCREETVDGQVPPFAEAPWKEHPRVFRLRNLVGAAPLKPYAEIPAFNRYAHNVYGTDDGRYFILEGIHQGPHGKRHEIWAIDGATGRKLWEILSLTGDYAPARPLDPLGKMILIQHPNEDFGSLIDAATGKPLRTMENVSALGPNADVYVVGRQLTRRADKVRLVNLDCDSLSDVYVFDKAGRHVLARNTTGPITVWALEEVRRRLTLLGLGW